MKNIIAILGIGVLLTSCQITKPYAVTNNAIGSKRGTSKTAMIFGRPYANSLSSGFVLNPNYGVLEAAKNGNINKIATVDLKYKNYLLFGEAEIIVTGE